MLLGASPKCFVQGFGVSCLSLPLFHASVGMEMFGDRVGGGCRLGVQPPDGQCLPAWHAMLGGVRHGQCVPNPPCQGVLLYT